MSPRLNALLLAAAALSACQTRPFESARALESAGKLSEAAIAYRDLAKTDPSNLPAWDKAIELFCRKIGDVGECLGVLDLELDRLGKIDRHSDALAEVLETRARARLEQGLVDAALDDLGRGERVSPGRASLFVVEARALLMKGQQAQATRAIDRARTLDPNNREADALVASLGSAGRADDAPFGGP
ncbi:MAG: hypothetical protein U1E65_12360 [Myxococcota bacterium]